MRFLILFLALSFLGCGAYSEIKRDLTEDQQKAVDGIRLMSDDEIRAAIRDTVVVDDAIQGLRDIAERQGQEVDEKKLRESIEFMNREVAKEAKRRGIKKDE